MRVKGEWAAILDEHARMRQRVRSTRVDSLRAPTRRTDKEDVLGDDELGDGVQTRIRFKRAGNTCRWDLKVVYSVDDSSAVWSNVDLCKISKITIKYNRKNDQTSALFD